MTAEQFLSRTVLAYAKHAQGGGQQRYGQFMFNTLRAWHPALAESLRSTEADPFYSDDKMIRFIEHVYKNWEEYPR